jgi:hypothetical protein
MEHLFDPHVVDSRRSHGTNRVKDLSDSMQDSVAIDGSDGPTVTIHGIVTQGCILFRKNPHYGRKQSGRLGTTGLRKREI